MSKAIVEMTPQELQQYNPAQNLHRSLDRDRWEQAWAIVPQLATLLKQRFRATRVVLTDYYISPDLHKILGILIQGLGLPVPSGN